MRPAPEIPEMEIVRAYILVQLYADAIIPGFGIETYEWHVLYRLRDAAPMTQAELGRQLLRDPMNVSRLVRGLEARGLVQRVVSRSDSRARLVSLTPLGDELLDRVMAALDRAEPLRGWSRGDLRTLTALLRRASESMRDVLVREGIVPARDQPPPKKRGRHDGANEAHAGRVDRPEGKEPLPRGAQRSRRRRTARDRVRERAR